MWLILVWLQIWYSVIVMYETQRVENAYFLILYVFWLLYCDRNVHEINQTFPYHHVWCPVSLYRQSKDIPQDDIDKRKDDKYNCITAKNSE